MNLLNCIYCCNREIETFNDENGYNIYCPKCFVKSVVAEDKEKAEMLWNYEHCDPFLIQWLEKDLNSCKKCHSDKIRIVLNQKECYFFVYCKKCFRMTYKNETLQIAEDKWNEENPNKGNC